MEITYTDYCRKAEPFDGLDATIVRMSEKLNATLPEGMTSFFCQDLWKHPALCIWDTTLNGSVNDPDNSEKFRSVRNELSKIAAKENLEIGGGMNIPNPERQAWEAKPENYPPKRPDKGNLQRQARAVLTAAGQPISTYRINKLVKAAEAKYREEYNSWLEYRRANIPGPNLPGLVFSFAALGTSAEIQRFYSGTKYWGD